MHRGVAIFAESKVFALWAPVPEKIERGAKMSVPSETLAELARAFTFLMHRTRYWKHPHFQLKRHSRMKPRVTQHGKGTLSPAYKTPCEQK